MKKYIAALTIFAALLFSFLTTIRAGTADIEQRAQSWVSLAQDISDAKQLTGVIYPGYAPNLKVNGVSKPWGLGVAILYPLGDYAFTGARLDFLGNNWFAPSVNVGLQAHLKVFGFDVTPFTMGGAIMPLTGAGDKNTTVGAILGAGVTATVWQSKDSNGKPDGKAALNIFGAVERWTLYDGQIYRPGVALTVHF